MKIATVAVALFTLISVGVSAAPIVEMEKRYCLEFLGITKCATCAPDHICPEKRDGGVEVEFEKRSLQDDEFNKRICYVNFETGKGGCTTCTIGHLCPEKRKSGYVEAELI